jgi:hypothetical protein
MKIIILLALLLPTVAMAQRIGPDGAFDTGAIPEQERRAAMEITGRLGTRTPAWEICVIELQDANKWLKENPGWEPFGVGATWGGFTMREMLYLKRRLP